MYALPKRLFSLGVRSPSDEHDSVELAGVGLMDIKEIAANIKQFANQAEIDGGHVLFEVLHCWPEKCVRNIPTHVAPLKSSIRIIQYITMQWNGQRVATRKSAAGFTELNLIPWCPRSEVFLSVMNELIILKKVSACVLPDEVVDPFLFAVQGSVAKDHASVGLVSSVGETSIGTITLTETMHQMRKPFLLIATCVCLFVFYKFV